MKNIGQCIFTFLVLVLVSIGLYIGRDWNTTTILFPQFIGFPVIGMATVSLVLDIVKLWRGRAGKAVDRESTITAARGILAIFGWLIGFIIVTWVIGFIFAVPIFVFAFMKVQGKYSWIKSIIYAAIAGAFVYIVFVLVFRVVWPKGILIDQISRAL